MRYQSPSSVPSKRPYGSADPSDSDPDNGDSAPAPKRTFVRGAASMGRGPARNGGPSNDAPMKPNSFAAKMMAKMGYVAGQGLGSEGQGILNPVDTKLRPQGVGLGAVSEKTQQAKKEEKRAAEARGETIVDSSEEERERRRRQKKSRSTNGATLSASGGFTKPKTKFRTRAEIEEEAKGLHIPTNLMSIIDVTGTERKELSSASGLMTQQFLKGSAPETEEDKIAKRARRDLDHCVEEWQGLSERMKFIDEQEARLTIEVGERERGISRIERLITSMDDLLTIQNTSVGDLEAEWDQLSRKLGQLEAAFEDDVETYNLPEVAVAAIYDLFKRSMSSWFPLESPTFLTSYLVKLRHILGVRTLPDIQTLTLSNGSGGHRYSKNASPFESLLSTYWLPRVRTAIINDWNVNEPKIAIDLIEAWKPILPAFIYYSTIETQIIPKLSTALQSWSPPTSKRQQNGPTASPSDFFFPWLAILPVQYLDAGASTGLLADLRRALRVALQKWDISSYALLPGLDNYRSLLPTHVPDLLTRYLLPRLSRHLKDNLIIDPSDQDLTPLKQVQIWFPYFSTLTTAELLHATFFPKWLTTLHIWLTSPTSDGEEIIEWFTWWKGRFSDELSTAIGAGWKKGMDLIEAALELGDQAAEELPLPDLSELTRKQKPIKILQEEKEGRQKEEDERKKKDQAKAETEITFRDILEGWCEEESLLLMPMREAHADTGEPLLRITASASGKGGVVVYIKGDTLMARHRKDKGLFEPVGLGDGLLARAEGK